MTLLNIPFLVFVNPIALVVSLAAAWFLYMLLVRRGVK